MRAEQSCVQLTARGGGADELLARGVCAWSDRGRNFRSLHEDGGAKGTALGNAQRTSRVSSRERRRRRPRPCRSCRGTCGAEPAGRSLLSEGGHSSLFQQDVTALRCSSLLGRGTGPRKRTGGRRGPRSRSGASSGTRRSRTTERRAPERVSAERAFALEVQDRWAQGGASPNATKQHGQRLLGPAALQDWRGHSTARWPGPQTVTKKRPLSVPGWLRGTAACGCRSASAAGLFHRAAVSAERAGAPSCGAAQQTNENYGERLAAAASHARAFRADCVVRHRSRVVIARLVCRRRAPLHPPTCSG